MSHLLDRLGAPGRRIITALTLFAFLFTVSCSSWKVIPLVELQEDHVNSLYTKTVRFHTDAGWVEMEVRRIDYPFIEGTNLGRSVDRASTYPGQIETVGSGRVRVDLRTVNQAEVLGISGVKSVFVVVGVAAAVFLALVLIAIATKESCPILYMETADGWQMVGEAYAGSAFKSIQRDDLLPLPQSDAGTVRLLLSNEARETQYTDVAELVVADHPAGTRVVSTFEQKPMLVTEDAERGVVSTFGGIDVSGAVAAQDEVEWTSDLEALVDVEAPPLRDGLVATFSAPAPGQRPVLEFRAANTFLLDATFGRFFALMGEDLDKLIDKGNQPDRRDRIRRWREREGVDLEVEAMTPEGWSHVATVWTVGPMALRTIAVPLPPEAIVDGAVTVRFSGGTGFWRFDRVALSSVRDEEFSVQRIAPRTALNHHGGDERANLAAADGRYHVLEDVGDKLTLEFELPPPPPGRVRTAFFYSDGYYNVHPPYQSARSLRTLKTIRDEEGSLARFAIDLYRDYYRRAAEAPYEQAGAR